MLTTTPRGPADRGAESACRALVLGLVLVSLAGACQPRPRPAVAPTAGGEETSQAEARAAARKQLPATDSADPAPDEREAGAPPQPFEDPRGLWGYRDTSGAVVIAPRYAMAQEFTSGGFAAVADRTGWSFIDRRGQLLVRPFLFDNGPDPFSEGLCRFVGQGGKLGYFSSSGEVAIPARYDFGQPFRDGRARVCQGCKKVIKGEHASMAGGEWWSIDRTGRRLTE